MRVAALSIVCLMFLGCSSNKVDNFKNNLGSSAKVYNVSNISSLSAVPLSSSPIKGALTEQDALIAIDGNKTAFDLYSFKGEVGAHILTMRTFCDCFGFNKDLLLPDVRIIDSGNSVIVASLMSKQKVQPLLGAFYFEFTWVFDTTSTDPVKVVIGSNNQKLGDVATTVDGVGAVGVPSGNSTYYTGFTIEGLSVRSAPYGKYEVFAE